MVEFRLNREILETFTLSSSENGSIDNSYFSLRQNIEFYLDVPIIFVHSFPMEGKKKRTNNYFKIILQILVFHWLNTFRVELALWWYFQWTWGVTKAATAHADYHKSVGKIKEETERMMEGKNTSDIFHTRLRDSQ